MKTDNLNTTLSDAAKVFFDHVMPIIDIDWKYKVIEKAAYSKAEKEHPQWVCFAEYHKKRRIRKKYHNRIIKNFIEAKTERK